MPPLSTTIQPSHIRHALLLIVVIATATFGLTGERISQPLSYHAFADTRSWAELPNGCDVLSNLPFLVIGIAGLAYLARSRQTEAFAYPLESAPYTVFFFGIALTSFGSSYYHWSPDNSSLVWDRLPMTLTFMSLLAAMIVERIDRRVGLALLAPLVVLGVSTVWYWQWSYLNGNEDLRPYLVVQFGGIILILTIASLYRSRYSHSGVIWVVGAIYVLAKMAEVLDIPIYQFTEAVSGHTIKHLIAATAAYALLVSLQRRRLKGV